MESAASIEVIILFSMVDSLTPVNITKVNKFFPPTAEMLVRYHDTVKLFTNGTRSGQ